MLSQPPTRGGRFAACPTEAEDRESDAWPGDACVALFCRPAQTNARVYDLLRMSRARQ